MTYQELPPPDCKYGYTQDQLEQMFGVALPVFKRWMRGQTVMVCEGVRYNHDTNKYEDDCVTGHGMITYAHDVARWLGGREIID